MLSERSRKARDKLLEKYCFGRAGYAGSPNVTVDRIHLSGPDEVTVGEEFILIVTTEPEDVDAIAFVTVEPVAPFRYNSRQSAEGEEGGPYPSERTRAPDSPKGIDPPYYGRVSIEKGTGEIRLTQHSNEGVRLRVSLGDVEATWSIDREHVRC